jgi:predicted ATPase
VLERGRAYQSGAVRKDADKKPIPEATRAYYEKMKKKESQMTDWSMNSILADLDSRHQEGFIPYPYSADEMIRMATEVHRRQLQRVGREMVWDGNSLEVFQSIALFFGGHESSDYELHKGIYLMGPVGVGKSLILNTMSELCTRIEQRLREAGKSFTPRAFSMDSTVVISRQIEKEKKTDSMEQYMDQQRCFDDTGMEDSIKVYGNEIHPMAEILTSRYVRYQRTGLVTHATSNKPYDQLSGKYGTRVESRVSEMFNHITITGVDKRPKDSTIGPLFNDLNQGK